MIVRTAALFALFAFVVAWVVGVLAGHSPSARVETATIALGFGAAAGLGCGIALEKIVLARIARDWKPEGAPKADPQSEIGERR